MCGRVAAARQDTGLFLLLFLVGGSVLVLPVTCRQGLGRAWQAQQLFWSKSQLLSARSENATSMTAVPWKIHSRSFWESRPEKVVCRVERSLSGARKVAATWSRPRDGPLPRLAAQPLVAQKSH